MASRGSGFDRRERRKYKLGIQTKKANRKRNLSGCNAKAQRLNNRESENV
jgi:hypothetical protein